MVQLDELVRFEFCAEVAELVDAKDLPQNHVGFGVPSTQCGAVVKSNKMYCVYVLKSTKNNQLYVGRTSDLKKRISEHQSGKVRTTNRLNPMKFLFFEGFIAKADAIRRERYFKTSKGKSSLKQIIRESLK